MAKRNIILFICVLVVFSACTFQKRIHRRGYYVHWNSSKQMNNANKEITNFTDEKTKSISIDHDLKENEEYLTASTNTDIIIPEKPVSFYLNDDCGDSLILKSGTSSKVMIIEVTETEVLYKRCANLNGPVIVISKYDVARIRYVTGNVESFADLKKNDLKKIVKGESKFAPDTTSRVSLAFAIMFLFTWFLMMVGIIIKMTLLYFIGLIPTVILFFVALFTAAYALYKIKTDPEHHTGKSKAGLALFILLFGALIAAVPPILIYMGLLVL